MTKQGYFITGTDTGVGKTRISCALIHRLREQGYRVAGMKPVASGAFITADGLRNDDALQLIASAQCDTPYDIINPYCFEPPIAPHIAAAQVGCSIELDHLLACYQRLHHDYDGVVVEGAGGWLVPLNAHQTLEDLALALQLPVILVVGMRLGCLNHALLTARAIHNCGLTLAGWVANSIEPATASLEENIAYLEKHLTAPLLGFLPYQENASAADAASGLNFSANVI